MFGVVDQSELPFPLAEVSASVVGGRIQFERGVGLLGYKLSEKWGEIGRGSIEGILQGNVDYSKLFLSLRDARAGLLTVRVLGWLEHCLG